MSRFDTDDQPFYKSDPHTRMVTVVLPPGWIASVSAMPGSGVVLNTVGITAIAVEVRTVQQGPVSKSTPKYPKGVA